MSTDTSRYSWIGLGKLLAILAALSVTVALSGCKEKGPMEKAGEKIDQAVEDTSDAAEDAMDDAKDAADDAGDEMEDAADDAADAVNDMMN